MVDGYTRQTFVEFLVQLPLPYVYSAWIYWWTKQPGLDRFQQAIPFFESSRFKQFSGLMLLATFIAQGTALQGRRQAIDKPSTIR